MSHTNKNLSILVHLLTGYSAKTLGDKRGFADISTIKRKVTKGERSYQLKELKKFLVDVLDDVKKDLIEIKTEKAD